MLTAVVIEVCLQYLKSAKKKKEFGVTAFIAHNHLSGNSTFCIVSHKAWLQEHFKRSLSVWIVFILS